jgi:hypothetical protein
MAEFAGLAGEIRSLLCTEQIDLGGYTEVRATDLVKNAFGTPLDAPTKMISIKFVVGGGKLVRAKYNDDLTKWMISALREVGYAEDRSAAETFDSQGFFKQQHDTGQNLKYLVVYPKVTCGDATKAGAEDVAQAPTLDTNSPTHIVKVSEVATFKEIVASKVGSYRQKKVLLKILQDAITEFQIIEQKLMNCVKLDEMEQLIYDSNSGSDEEKVTYLQGEIKAMVDAGKLTQEEKAELLKSIDGNIESVVAEIAAAENPKAIEKLTLKGSKIKERKDVIWKMTPVVHRLKHADEVQKFRIKLFGLLAMEDKGRSMSLTMADLSALSAKDEIEEAIAALEQASRGWFEDDEDFQRRCKVEEKEAKVKYNAKAKGEAAKKKVAPGAGTHKNITSRASSTSTANRELWSAPLGKNKAATSSYASIGVKKPVTSNFAAAFDNSDSD